MPLNMPSLTIAPGRFRIELRMKDGQAELLVADNGVGSAADFDLTKVKSLGLQLVPLLLP